MRSGKRTVAGAVIMSNHEFSFTPPKDAILERLQKMKEYGADILKNSRHAPHSRGCVDIA